MSQRVKDAPPGPDPVEGVGHTLDTVHRNAFGVFRSTAS
jgi:hypothetical protein